MAYELFSQGPTIGGDALSGVVADQRFLVSSVGRPTAGSSDECRVEF